MRSYGLGIFPVRHGRITRNTLCIHRPSEVTGGVVVLVHFHLDAGGHLAGGLLARHAEGSHSLGAHRQRVNSADLVL